MLTSNNDKFYSRILSKETSAAAPSFRVYYGSASGAVPFVWESQPGTPKASVTTDAIPPLTPPPSYQYSNPKNSKGTSSKNSSKASSLLHCCLLPKLTIRNKGLSSSPSSSSSVSSSGSSSGSHRRSRSLQSSFDFNESGDEGSPRSTLTTSRRMKGCWAWA